MFIPLPHRAIKQKINHSFPGWYQLRNPIIQHIWLGLANACLSFDIVLFTYPLAKCYSKVLNSEAKGNTEKARKTAESILTYFSGFDAFSLSLPSGDEKVSMAEGVGMTKQFCSKIKSGYYLGLRLHVPSYILN